MSYIPPGAKMTCGPKGSRLQNAGASIGDACHFSSKTTRHLAGSPHSALSFLHSCCWSNFSHCPRLSLFPITCWDWDSLLLGIPRRVWSAFSSCDCRVLRSAKEMREQFIFFLIRSLGSVYFIVVWAMLLRLSVRSAPNSDRDLGVKSCIGSQATCEGDGKTMQTLLPIRERGRGATQ